MTSSSRVVLITGATGGIGKEIAVGLARPGWTVVVVGRDRDRGQAALADIKERSGSQAVHLMLADLSSQQDIRQFADTFVSRYGRLDVLVNNVGGLFGKRWETADGLESTLAINHLCPFLLTHQLLPLMQKSRPSRIVNINSEGHQSATTVDFDAFGPTRWKRGFPLYSQAKLANLLFTYELAARLDGTGVTVNAVHPGMVDTPLFRRFVSERFHLGGSIIGKATMFLARNLAYRWFTFDTVEAAAACPIYLASSADVEHVSGKYFNLDKTMLESSPASHNSDLSRAVWKASAELCGLSEEASFANVVPETRGHDR
jgi:NAD(P)-dependent dehydrogenase (short-subunit alcohol dehydrogenase family)